MLHTSHWLTLLAASCALLLAACGRLGFELHDLDAGAGTAAQSATGVPARSGASPSGATKKDAGPPPTAASAGLPGAFIQPPSRAAAVSGTGADDASACSSDDACKSGRCVAGVCCESRCDNPPQCFVADGATCRTGHCEYLAAASGTACDDANSCTEHDRCEHGSCAGGAQCDDKNACTRDFCGPGRCAHASSCEPSDHNCSYAQREGHGYWLCPGPVSFDAAHAECKRIGARLATIEDAREQLALWQLGMRDTWIGYRARTQPDSDAGFDWVDGDSSFEDWAKPRSDPDDPDAGTADRCAYLAASADGAWQSRACHDKFAGFACELEQFAAPELGCSYERRGSHGYFECKAERTWLEAEQRCADSGAYLLELDDAEEQAFVLARWKPKPETKYAIGVSDAQREGSFVTSRGQALHFSAWAAGEPSAASAELDYGVLTSAGTWQSVGPAQPSRYICEQER